MNIVEFLQIIFTCFLVLFLPGYTISFILFSQGKIALLERIALSIVLSVSIVPLLLFYTNLTGLKVTKESVIVQVLIIILVSELIYLIKKRYGKKD